MSAVHTVIVGAGPYGLSLAAHLRAKRVPFEIFGRPMESWRAHMPAGMLLKSEPFATNLSDPDGAYTLERYYASLGTPYNPMGVPLPIADLLDYADWFRRHVVPDVVDRTLTRLSRTQGGFELAFADGGRVQAGNVVLATGFLAYRWSPPTLDQLPAHLASHTADHRDLRGFAGRDVVVVGSGQAGLETAALLHEQGATVRILARAAEVSWNNPPQLSRSLAERLLRPEAGLGAGWRSWVYSEKPRLFYHLPEHVRRHIVATGWGPSGAWWLKERIVGRVSLLTGHRVERAREQDGRVRLSVRAAGRLFETDTDHVMAATGYRVDLKRLQFLDPALKAALDVRYGAPRLSTDFESSVPGLYFIGMASAQSFGPAMRFIYGAKHPAARLARRLSSIARTKPWIPVAPAGKEAVEIAN